MDEMGNKPRQRMHKKVQQCRCAKQRAKMSLGRFCSTKAATAGSHTGPGSVVALCRLRQK